MSSGNDIITGTSAADIIDAGDGDDVVNAMAGNDTITGGKGDDILNGGAGNDTYNYSRGDGNDTITEGNLAGSSDRLVLQGINPGDVTLVRNGNDVTRDCQDFRVRGGHNGREGVPLCHDARSR